MTVRRGEFIFPLPWLGALALCPLNSQWGHFYTQTLLPDEILMESRPLVEHLWIYHVCAAIHSCMIFSDINLQPNSAPFGGYPPCKPNRKQQEMELFCFYIVKTHPEKWSFTLISHRVCPCVVHLEVSQCWVVRVVKLFLFFFFFAAVLLVSYASASSCLG